MVSAVLFHKVFNVILRVWKAYNEEGLGDLAGVLFVSLRKNYFNSFFLFLHCCHYNEL